MGRIFSFIIIVSVLTIALAGGGVFFLEQSNHNEIKKEAINSLAKGIAQSISTRTDLLSQSLQNIAQSPGLIVALNQADLPRAKTLVHHLSSYLPDAMVFRLLLPSDNSPDRSVSPHMGYADLELVKNTFLKPRLPLIQGEQGENRHMAITQGIEQDGKIIAVILASVDFTDLQNNFNLLAEEQVYTELKQADVVLFSHGSADIKATGKLIQVKVNNTAWVISSWYQDNFNLMQIKLVLGIILGSAIISCLAGYIGFRLLCSLLIHDQRSILSLCKDLIEGRHGGNYPVKLKVMSGIISSLFQFKHEQDIFATKAVYAQDNIRPSGEPSFSSNQLVGIEVKDADSEEIDTLVSLPESFEQASQAETEAEPVIPPLPTGDKPDNAAEKKSSPSDVIFKAYDIRGIVDQTLTQDIVFDLGRAIGSEAVDKGISTLIIARDGRISSPALSKVLSDGILLTGTNILDIGTVPTPVLYFVAHHHDFHSGVMLTGSHNPANYNGLKIVLAGETLAGDRIKALKNRIDTGNLYSNKLGKITQNSMFTNEYIGIISEDIHIARPMKVVVDAGNGVAGEIAPVLLRTLGCEVIELFCNIDGSFPNHHPDPSKPQNLKDLIAAVEENQADIGFAFDGDGDRLGVVDSFGNIIWPDRQMMLFSKSILAKKPGSEIIYDVKCSRNLPAQIIRNGGTPTIWKTGHSLMKAKLKQSGAIFAGEMSGHLFFNDRWFGFDDGLYSAARLIEILSEDSRASAMVFAEFPNSPNTPELNIELEEGENFAIMEQLFLSPNLPKKGRITDIDGLRIDFTDGFGLVRASNTTPSLVVRFEGETEEVLVRIQELFRQLILEIKPDIALPF